MSYLEALDVSYQIQFKPIFNNINFSLGEGELLHIIGANGSGKTSLLRLIAGLVQATTGKILWAKTAIDRCARTYREQFIYIGHTLGINDDLTPREHLRISRELQAQPSSMPIDEILKRVALYEQGDLLSKQLSAGQKQRLALAKLLLTKAPIWILDEPLSALDQSGRHFLVELITRHVSNGGRVIMTSHQEVNMPEISKKILKLNAHSNEDGLE